MPSSREEGVRLRLSFNENVELIGVVLRSEKKRGNTDLDVPALVAMEKKTTTLDVQEPFWRLRAKQLAGFLQNKRAQNLLQVKMRMFVVLKTSRYPAASD